MESEICEMCGSSNATVHLEQKTENKIVKFSLCRKCASKIGIVKEGENKVIDFLFKVELDDDSIDRKSKCSNCGCIWSQVGKDSMLGCEECYKVFRESLKKILSRIQEGVVHTGKIPLRRERKLTQLNLIEDKPANS